MGNDHKLLHIYLGDEMFDAMGHAYVAANPSQNPNLRWFSSSLPDFLKSTEPYSKYPVLSDLAALEKALNDAFDAKDAASIGVADMAGFSPGAGAGLEFRAHPRPIRLGPAATRAAFWAPPTAVRGAAGPPRAATRGARSA